MQYPGYRDRMAFVCLSGDEGGLNLNMQKQTIKALADRGLVAACKLVDKFLTSPEARQNWITHVQNRALHYLAGHLCTIEKYNNNYRQYDGGQVSVLQKPILMAEILDKIHKSHNFMHIHQAYLTNAMSMQVSKNQLDWYKSRPLLRMNVRLYQDQ